MNSGELKVDVPLASVESDCEDLGETASQTHTPSKKLPRPQQHQQQPPNRPKPGSAGVRKPGVSPRFNLDAGGGGDSVTGSLEDLVSSFDEKLTQCFHDYQEQVDKIAPVQVRSQEEIMNECQVWWTITGNFGNMMPIDWSKSTIRAKQLPTLGLNMGKNGGPGGKKRPGFQSSEDLVDGLEDEDDMVAADLDMHSLILTSNPHEHSEPLKSADEVIKEIDDIIDAADDDEAEGQPGEGGGEAVDAGGAGADAGAADPYGQGQGQTRSFLPRSRIVNQALKGRKLEELSSTELSQILTDIELLVKDLSEELVNDLGVRDELEYEKELKNTFISLLLSIQSKRRACGTSASASDSGGHNSSNLLMTSMASRKSGGTPNQQFKYLTTVIPYQPDKGAPNLQTLQVLVKILKAINEDSPAVPALLTDYILKVLCPS